MGGSSLPLRKTARTTKAVVVDIEAYEKKTHLIFQKTPFANRCRHIVEHMVVKTGLRFREQSMLTLQEAAEAYLLSLLSKANRIVQHSNRKKVTARDLEFVYNMDIPVDSEEEKKEKSVPKTASTRMVKLFRQANIEMIGPDLHAATDKILNYYLLEVLQNCNTLVQSRRTQSVKDVVSPTVSVSDVAFALSSVNMKLFGIATIARPKRVPTGPKGELAQKKNTNRELGDFALEDEDD